ncbi:MAG: hypothetical protein MUP85_18450 [Candidatus Lokiarchaeota archaeon]|nr:hypothetical protein [Candidatus Lokiarchaeota archaeon]
MTKKKGIEEELGSRIKEMLLKDSHRLKEKYPPLSDIINDTRLTLQINRLYELSGDLRQLYMIIAKSKNGKLKYLICITLASQSSDFLVSLARKTIKDETSLRLLQFSLIPKHLRVNLLCLKEIEHEDDLQGIITLLKQVRSRFRKTLENITSQMNNF